MPEITRCRICDSIDLIPYLDLGKQPWCNDFLMKDQIGEEKYYPLEVALCDNCKASQLTYNVPKETMFYDHTYVSGTTSTLRRHFHELAEYTKKRYDIQTNDLIVDIGGNDGTNLQEYRSIHCLNVLNVESAKNISEIAEENGIPTVNAFFNNTVADDIINKKGQAKAILASGVFFHVEELHSICRGISRLLKDDGVFVVQFMYYKSILEKLNYDSIYHEHLLYYTIKSIRYLLEMYGLYVDHLFYSGIHGGSMMMYCTKKKKDTSDLDSFIDGVEIGLDDIRTYQNFAIRVQNHREKLSDTLHVLHYQEHNNIYGYGAPAKGNTLLNYVLGKDTPVIQEIEEANELKWNRYTPNTHIHICNYKMVRERPPYYLILAWNFLQEFLTKQSEIEYLEKGGNFIVPFPYEPFIINKDNYTRFQ